MNYGDYAYIEAFPRGMFQFFPDPNIARRAQLFEIWIRPVVPENAHMALRIALHELEQARSQNGLTQEDFEATRDYLMKNVYLHDRDPGPAARLRARLAAGTASASSRRTCASGSRS